MAELGIANAMARSAFVNQVDEELCSSCGLCLEQCQFDALWLNDVVHVNETRCLGCGVCVSSCPDEALGLIRRPAEEAPPPPVTEKNWLAERATARGLSLDAVL